MPRLTLVNASALALCLSLGIVTPRSARAQVGAVASAASSGASTAVVLDQVQSALDQVLVNAQQRGDYLVSRGAIEALGAIRAFKEANEDLMNKAFRELDAKQIALFADAERFTQIAEQATAAQIAQVRKVAADMNQLSEATYLSGRRSYVLHQSVVIVPPTARDTLQLELTGVNLDVAQPRLMLPGGGVARSTILGPTQITYRIPLAALPRDSGAIRVHELRLKHRTRAGRNWNGTQKWEEVDRTVTLATLPARVGTYQVSGTRTVSGRETRQYTATLQTLSGTNTTVTDVARPPAGYTWDLGAGDGSGFTVGSAGGEAATCQKVVMNGSNADGIIVQARVDRINEGPSRRYPVGRWAPGHITCTLTGTVSKPVTTSAPLPTVIGTLGWVEDVLVPLPSDLSAFEFEIRTFDGRVRRLTANERDRLFDLRKEPTRLVLRPVAPVDIVQ